MGRNENNDKGILKTALDIMEKYLSKIYLDPEKYRSFMNEHEVIDTMQILSWSGEGEMDCLYDWIHKMRRIPC